MTIDPSKPPTSAWGCLFRIGVAIVAVSIPILVAGVVYVAREHQKHVDALANEVQAISARGEPLTSDDLANLYRLPDGVADVTSVYLEALKPIEDQALLAQLDRLKPYCTLHQQGKEPPLRPQVWDRLNEVQEDLLPFRELLEKLTAAAKRTGGVRYPLDFSPGWEAPIPHAIRCRSLLPALELQAICHCQRGNHSQAADSIIATIRLAETLRYEPLLASQLIRIALLKVAIRLTAYAAADTEFPAVELARLQAAFAAVEFESIRVPVLLGERVCGYITNSHPLPAPLADLELSPGTVLTKCRPGDCAFLLSLQREAIEVGRLPLPQAMVAAKKVKHRYFQTSHDARNLPRWMKNYVTHSEFLLPSSTFGWFGRIETECRAAVTFCACERFRREKNDEVVRLQELVPEFISSLPLDPFSAQPLSIIRWTDREYAIYGFGEDGVDNSGEGVGFNVSNNDFGIKSFVEHPTAVTE